MKARSMLIRVTIAFFLQIADTGAYPVGLDHIIAKVCQVAPAIIRIACNADIIGMTCRMDGDVLENNGIRPGKQAQTMLFS